MRLEKNERWRKMVGNRLEVTRIALGRKQADLARILLISPQRWNNYERGAKPLDIEIAIRICDKFGVTLDWLYRGDLSTLRFELAQRIGQLVEGETAIKN